MSPTPKNSSNLPSFNELSVIKTSLKVGLFSGSHSQHFCIRAYRGGGQSDGHSRRSPFSSSLIISVVLLMLTPLYGSVPYVVSSHSNTPNATNNDDREKLSLNQLQHNQHNFLTASLIGQNTLISTDDIACFSCGCNNNVADFLYVMIHLSSNKI